MRELGAVVAGQGGQGGQGGVPVVRMQLSVVTTELVTELHFSIPA